MTKKQIFQILVVAVAVLAVGALFSDLFTKDLTSFVRFDGKQDHTITLAEASKLTGNFQQDLAPGDLRGGYFGEEALSAILNQDGVTGLRFYFGLSDDGNRHLILVGVDQQGDDLVNGLLAERQCDCPPICSKVNVLNTPQIEYSVN